MKNYSVKNQNFLSGMNVPIDIIILPSELKWASNSHFLKRLKIIDFRFSGDVVSVVDAVKFGGLLRVGKGMENSRMNHLFPNRHFHEIICPGHNLSFV